MSRKQELIEFLQGLPDDVELIHSSDDEGNHISRAAFSRSKVFIWNEGTNKEQIIEIANEDVGTEYNVEDVREAVVFW